jgi:hypothetical protein
MLFDPTITMPDVEANSIDSSDGTDETEDLTVGPFIGIEPIFTYRELSQRLLQRLWPGQYTECEACFNVAMDPSAVPPQDDDRIPLPHLRH